MNKDTFKEIPIEVKREALKAALIKARDVINPQDQAKILQRLEFASDDMALGYLFPVEDIGAAKTLLGWYALVLKEAYRGTDISQEDVFLNVLDIEAALSVDRAAFIEIMEGQFPELGVSEILSEGTQEFNDRLI